MSRAGGPLHLLTAALLLQGLGSPADAAEVTEHVLQAAVDAVEAEAERVRAALQAQGKAKGEDGIDMTTLAGVWSEAFTFTAQYAWSVFEDDGTTFVSTGDIGQMWLRDSSVQLMPYVPLAAKASAGSPLRTVMEGAMKRQVRFILSDPYASAFFDSSGPAFDKGPNKQECPPSPTCQYCSCSQCSPACGNYTYQKDYELDSLLFPLLLHHRYWRETGSAVHINEDFAKALRAMLDLMHTEQWHFSKSKYFYKPLKGEFKEGIGLVWSFAMPSDDQEIVGYNIPQNLMLVVALRQAAELADGPLADASLAAELEEFAASVDTAVRRHGIVAGPDGKMIFAFEVDGWGNSTRLDDANMPNLLWLPYLGYSGPRGVYEATRSFVLSGRNENFFSGHNVSGLGSKHHSFGLRFDNPGPECRGDCIWHLGLVMQGMTADSRQERLSCMRQVLSTLAGQHVLHEAFDPARPDSYTRDGFGWANALFSEWVLRDWAGSDSGTASGAEEAEQRSPKRALLV